MDIAAVDPFRASFPAKEPTASRADGSFRDMLGNMLVSAEADQAEAKKLTESMARGETQDIHRVMNAMNEADLSFRMVLEIRNKLVDAYQEIKRMPI